MNRAAGLALIIVLGAGGCDRFKAKTNDTTTTASPASTRLATQRRLQRTCASNATYDRLKVAMFEEAARVRGGRVDALDQLEAATLVRMESPVVKSRDEALNVTVCTGRFVLELPEGAVRAFNGERRLKADIEYSAQQAVDNSGLVYQMQGAEPIVYKLAALDLGRRTAGLEPRQAPTPASEPMADVAGDTRPVTEQRPIAVPHAPSPPRESTRAAEVAPPPPAPAPRREVAQREIVRPEAVRREAIQRDGERQIALQREAVRRDLLRREALQIETVRREAARRDALRREAAQRATPEFQTRVPTARSQPSFNCNRARLRVENMVCDSDRLAAADRAMSATYFRALAGADPDSRARLRQSRDRFLAFRNRCSNEGCVEQAYADRIAEIRDLSEER